MTASLAPRLLGLLLAACFPLSDVMGQEAGRDVVVLVKEAPPFAMKAEDGSWSGISVELWKEVSAQLGLKSRFEEATLEALLDGVGGNAAHVGLGALTVTSAREERLDFGHPYFDSGLGIATLQRGEAGWWVVVQRAFSGDFLVIVGALIALLLAVGLIVWLVERRRNPDDFGGGAARGIGEGFWWAAVTMTTVGYGDRTPKTVPGRALAMVWMFACLILISFFTAAIASSLTVSRLESSIKGPDDLATARVGTVRASTSGQYLRRKGIVFRPFPDAAAALGALDAGGLDAVVYDAPLLQYAVKQRHAERLHVLPYRFDRQAYAFAFPQGSTLREESNRVILARTAREDWQDVLRRYLGE